MWVVITLRPKQNGQHFPDDIFNWIFLNETIQIAIKISFKFVPRGPINNMPALIQIMVWSRQVTRHYLNQWWLFYWCIYASLGLNELCWNGTMSLKWHHLEKMFCQVFCSLRNWTCSHSICTYHHYIIIHRVSKYYMWKISSCCLILLH